MCVIMLIDKVRPTPTMVEKAWARNDDGGGLAWREKNKDGITEVLWKKGLEGADGLEEMHELISKLPLPFVAHFRVASCGGIRQSLTHPFQVDKKSSLALEGHTRGHVLFHNGDWKGWAEVARTAAINSGTHIPTGRWSDSRAMAWLCAIYGPGFMEFLPEQKGVYFGPHDYEIYTGTSGWDKVNDVWCSNKYYMEGLRNVGGTVLGGQYCRFGTCTSKNVDVKFYCPEHKDGVKQNLTVVIAGTSNVAEKKVELVGGAHPPIPFLQIAPGQLLGLEAAEQLSKQKDHTGVRLLSKSLLKRIRKLYSQMGDSGNVKKRIVARLELEKISQSLTLSGLKA